jgi:predicted ATPase
MKKSKIAAYARMASTEAHEEYMSLDNQQLAYYFKDILSEQIDKFDRIEAMANRRWYQKLFK